MALPTIKAVVFDVDDTICDSAEAFGRGIINVTTRYIPELAESEYSKVIEMWRADANGHYRQYTRGEILLMICSICWTTLPPIHTR